MTDRLKPLNCGGRFLAFVAKVAAGYCSSANSGMARNRTMVFGQSFAEAFEA
jgi:hypothetical protein